MYILPGYTSYNNEDGVLYISSKLFQNKVKLTEQSFQEKFFAIVKNGGCMELSTPLTRFLHEQELLSSMEEIKTALQNTRRLLNDTLLLTIMPTEGCNFRCTYCYEDHVPTTMTQQMLNQLKAFITEQASRFKSVHISWFGGEPILCKDTVIEISTLVQTLQTQFHFQYRSSMTTNGYLLDADCFQKLYAAGITSYQITLDGWIHDQTRPHVLGTGTLQTILDNLISISALPQDKYRFDIILRHNILNGDEDYSWYDYLYKLFGTDTRFSVAVRSVNDWGGDSVQSLNLLEGGRKAAYQTAHEIYLDKLGMKRAINPDSLFSRICYAAFPNGFVFRANGKIEKCTVALDNPKNLVGTLDPQQGVVLFPKAGQSWSESCLEPKCYTCPDILTCFNMQCKRDTIINGGASYCHRLQQCQMPEEMED